MTRSISRRHLIAGGAGAAGAAALTTAGPVAASSHLPPLSGQLVVLRRPIRVFDTRDPDNFFGRKLADGDTVAVGVGAASGGEFMTGVFVNVTITQTEGAGFITVRDFFTGDDFSDDDSPPPVTTSNLNWTSNDVTLANMTLSPVGAENSIEVICSGAGAATHVLVDVQGYVPFEFDDG